MTMGGARDVGGRARSLLERHRIHWRGCGVDLDKADRLRNRPTGRGRTPIKQLDVDPGSRRHLPDPAWSKIRALAAREIARILAAWALTALSALIRFDVSTAIAIDILFEVTEPPPPPVALLAETRLTRETCAAESTEI